MLGGEDGPVVSVEVRAELVQDDNFIGLIKMD